MLAASPIEKDAEEWAIHDYEGFEGAEVGEYYSFENIVELADYIRERGALGAQVLNYYGGNINDAKSRFEEYAGEVKPREDGHGPYRWSHVVKRNGQIKQGTIYTQMGDVLDAQDAAHLQTLCDSAGFDLRRVA